jgi:hypothetical protein
MDEFPTVEVRSNITLFLYFDILPGYSVSLSLLGGMGMRIGLCVLLLGCVGLPGISSAEQSPRQWVRRVTLAASCAASAWDVQTTASAIGRGGRESNGLFADPLGRVRWGRMIGFKAGVCGAMLAGQELRLFGRHTRRKDDIWIGINSGVAARFTIASVKNRAVKP